jgi:hypothetical protein
LIVPCVPPWQEPAASQLPPVPAVSGALIDSSPPELRTFVFAPAATAGPANQKNPSTSLFTGPSFVAPFRTMMSAFAVGATPFTIRPPYENGFAFAVPAAE